MKTYRGPEGDERLWFEPSEIEDIADDELRKAGLTPTVDNPVLDVERFIEHHLQAELDQHAPLDARVLGVTEFRPGKKPKVSINRDLTGLALDDEDGAPGALGRWRATVAHESGHILLHRGLVELSAAQFQLFETGASDERMLMRCLKREVFFGAGQRGDWREVQANRCMASLLMPRKVFLAASTREAAALGLQRRELQEGSGEVQALAGRLATFFEVSRQAALIRLNTIGLAVPRGASTFST